MAAVIGQKDEFLEIVIKSGLLTSEEVENAVWKYDLRQQEASIPVAQKFVDEGLLTKFQAEQLLRGRHRGLIFNGRFRLLYPVGSGGMGDVFAAEEIETNWKVAIKVPNAQRRQETAMRTRLQLEAEAGMRLAHPNILRTWELDEVVEPQGSYHYVVMELVKGISMRELLDIHHPLEVGQVCDIICQAAKGLSVAHAANLVHRDIKPENILVRSDGSVKVLDFGLAMLDEDDQEFAMAMILGQDRVGTADFVAPEQSVNSYDVDARADIYSLGATLYFGLTRRLMFPCSSIAEKVRSHRKREPAPITDFRQDVPEAVLKILKKMLAKDPDERYRSAQEVMEVLEPFAERKPVEFKYSAILRARAKLARKKKAQESSRASSGISRVKGPEMTDTAVRQDTKVNKRRSDESDDNSESDNNSESG